MNKQQYIWGTTAVIAVIVIVTVIATVEITKKPTYTFTPVTSGSIVQGVSVTGTVRAAQDVMLSFQSQGTVGKVSVATGDKVQKGQTLMYLKNNTAGAAIDQARAAIEAAQANYQKVLNGATSQQIDVTKSQVNTAQTTVNNAQKNLENTKTQQDVLVKNAHGAMLNDGLEAETSNTLSTTPITITGTYSGQEEGVYTISLYATGSGFSYTTSGLGSANGNINRGLPSPIGNGLFVTFGTTGIISADTVWTINVPNMKSASYVSASNNYQSALQTQTTAITTAQSQVDSAQAALQQAQANLSLQQTAARPEDVAGAKAQLDGAQAQLETAESSYANGVITAPFDGVITSVDAKIGEVAGPGKSVIGMISNEAYQVETSIPETQLNRVKVGDNAIVTLDAYGNLVTFQATIGSIDPASTMVNGLQAYQTKLQFKDKDDRIKEGMGANAIITDQQKDNVISVPQSDILKNGDTSFVLIDAGNGNVRQQNVALGLEGLNGSVEITSGLNVGDRIASL